MNRANTDGRDQIPEQENSFHERRKR
jgi:hypothetical protein